MASFFYKKMGSGPVVILLHGFPECGTLWRNIWPRLAENFTVIVPDLPGSGQTVLEQPSSIVQMAEGIKQIIDKENIDKAVIAGHSMGGYVAFAFADLYPDSVVGLSAVHSTPAIDDDEKKKTRIQSIRLLQREGGKRVFIENMVPNLFSPGFKQSDNKTVEDQIEESLKMNTESMVNFYNAMLERKDYTHILDNAGFPVHWVIGIHDTVMPYKKILGKSHRSPVNFVSFYQNCSHMSMLEAPTRLAEDLVKFISYSYKLQNDR